MSRILISVTYLFSCKCCTPMGKNENIKIYPLKLFFIDMGYQLNNKVNEGNRLTCSKYDIRKNRFVCFHIVSRASSLKLLEQISDKYIWILGSVFAF